MPTVSYKDISYERHNVKTIADFQEIDKNEETERFNQLINEIQTYIAKEHDDIIREIRLGKKKKETLTEIIESYLSTRQLSTTLTLKETINKIVDVMVGWERLQPLMDDDSVSEIFTNEELQVIKRVGRQDILTNISFESDEVLTQFIKNVAIRTGDKINHDKCIMDGFDFVNNVRINAGIYGSAVRTGEVVRKPYIVIRKYIAKDFERKDFIENGTFDEEIANFFDEYVEDAPFMIIGEPGAGKSTILDYIQKLKDPMRRTIRIEEEPESNTKFKNSVSFIERRVTGEEVRVKYDMAEFSKIAARLSGKDVFVGEVRDKAAWYLYRLADMGYILSYSIHGSSCEAGIYQTVFLMLLENPNMTFNQLMAKVCDASKFLVYVSQQKIVDVAEVTGYDPELGKPKLNYIFRLKINENGDFYWKKGKVSDTYSEQLRIKKKLRERRV